MSVTLLPVLSADSLMLYNSTKNMFVAKPNLRVSQTSDKLTGYPVLTANASEAGVFVIGNPHLESRPLPLSYPFYIRSATSLLDDRVYLGVDRTDPLTSVSSFVSGQSVLYMDAKDTRTVTWMVKDPTAPDVVGIIYYGIPYKFINTFFNTHLQVDPTNNFNLTASIDAQGETPEYWVFLPTSPIYVCQDSVEQCAMTRGTANAYNRLSCSYDNRICYNQYNEVVYFGEAECEKQCGIIHPKKLSQVSVLASTNVNIPSSAGKKNITVKVALLLSAGILLVAFLYWRHSLQISH